MDRDVTCLAKVVEGSSAQMHMPFSKCVTCMAMHPTCQKHKSHILAFLGPINLVGDLDACLLWNIASEFTAVEKGKERLQSTVYTPWHMAHVVYEQFMMVNPQPLD